MILLMLSLYAQEISFALRTSVEPRDWISRQSFFADVAPVFSDHVRRRLQKKASDSISLHHLFRWKGEARDSAAMLLLLRTDPEVKWASVRKEVLPPPPSDTPNFVPQQEYLLSNPGMDIISFWEEGYQGSGIQIADIEYGWGLLHEDLQGGSWNLNPQYLPHSDVAALGYTDHGTAVLGVLSAQENDFGCTGIAHQAQVELITEYSQDGWDRSQAMGRAIEQLNKGDILLLEMQDYGACEMWTCLVPAEIDPEIWSLTRFAVDAGIVVVAASGNGTQNLDDEWHEENYLSMGDSGAIIVGAGMSNLDHAWGLLNYGSRIDIQAWGYDVTTLGLETLEELNHDPLRSYTHTFSGTSASSVLVAGALALLQEWSLHTIGHPLSPTGLRQLIYDSGDASINYVPHINIVAARQQLLLSDRDNDGFFDAYYGGRDCDDDADLIHPGAQEDWYDGIDQNCDGLSDFDQDGDGYTIDEDCNDEDVQIHPEAQEEWYDDIDQNCDGLSDFDQDGDGYTIDEDCNDEQKEIFPEAEDVPRDDIDQDCDGVDAQILGCQTQNAEPSFWWFLLGVIMIRVRR